MIDFSTLGPGVEFLLTLIAFAIIVIGGFVWLRSTLVKQRHQELENLAQTRGQRIKDLKDEQQRMQEELTELRIEVRVLTETFTKALVEDIVRGVREGLEE